MFRFRTNGSRAPDNRLFPCFVLVEIVWMTFWGTTVSTASQVHLDGEVEVGIGHDSNPLLNPDAPARLGRVGDAFGLVTGRGRGTWTPGQWKSEMEYRGSWNVYRNRLNGSDATSTGSVTVGRTFGRAWTVQGLGLHERFGRSAFTEDRYRLWATGLSASFDSRRGMRVTGGSTMEWRSHPEFPVTPAGDGLRDRQWVGRLTVGQTFTPRFGGSLTVSGRINRANVHAFDYWTTLLGGYAWYALSQALTVSVGYTLDRRRGGAADQTLRAGGWQWGAIEGVYMGASPWGWAMTYAWYQYSGRDVGERFSGSQVTITALWEFGRSSSPVQTTIATPPRMPQYAPSRTSQGWRFTLLASNARSVALVGTFNGWDRNRHLLKGSSESGEWSITLPLPPGTHQYAFVIDDTSWVKPPDAPAYIEDAFGNWNGLISVPDSHTQP